MLKAWDGTNETKRIYKRAIRRYGKSIFIEFMSRCAIDLLDSLNDESLANAPSDRFWPIKKRVSILTNNLENAIKGTIVYSHKELFYENQYTIESGLKPNAKNIVEFASLICKSFYEGNGWEKHLVKAFSVLEKLEKSKVECIVEKLNSALTSG
jgi:hypothetical protein